MPVTSRRFVLLTIVAGLALSAGCGDGGAPVTKPGDGETTTLRIVSLSPALTQIVSEMGHRKSIVGVDDSHDEVFDKHGFKTIGKFPNFSNELLTVLKPTHVIAFAGKEGVPASLTKLADTAGFKLMVFPYPSNVRDVHKIIVGDLGAAPGGRIAAEHSLAGLFGDEGGGFFVAHGIAQQMGKIGELVDTVAYIGKKPRVLIVFRVEPRFQASGPETVLDDVLTQYAGGYNAAIPDWKGLSPQEIDKIEDPEKRKAALHALTQDPAKLVGTAPEFDREALLNAKPDVIVLVMPGQPPLKPIEEDPRLADLRGLDIPAVKNNRIALINDKAALLPGTTLPKVTAEMAKAVYPQLAAKIDALVAPVDVKADEKKDEKKTDEKKEPVKDAAPVEEKDKAKPDVKEKTPVESAK